MAIDEQSRHRMYLKLEQVLGPAEASTLMEHLPPVGWADVATKRDLENLAVATKRDIDNLAVATKRDIDNLAVATKRDIDNLAVLTKRDLDRLESRLETKLESALRAQTFRFMTYVTGLVTAVAGLAIAVARLI